jgi:hypothetical protein
MRYKYCKIYILQDIESECFTRNPMLDQDHSDDKEEGQREKRNFAVETTETRALLYATLYIRHFFYML